MKSDKTHIEILEVKLEKEQNLNKALNRTLDGKMDVRKTKEKSESFVNPEEKSYKENRVTELENALRESIKIATERETVLQQEELKRKQIMEKV